MGAAVRGLGLRSVVAPMLVAHSCAERGLREVAAHELRWARTVKSLDFPGHVGSLMTHPLPLAVIAALLLGMTPPALAILALALASRVVLAATADRAAGRRTASLWLIPPRDVLSFCVFVGSFCGQAVAWRGETFHVTADGDLVPAQRP
jgi:ceramide glucosyltransferase